MNQKNNVIDEFFIEYRTIGTISILADSKNEVFLSLEGVIAYIKDDPTIHSSLIILRERTNLNYKQVKGDF